MKESINPFTIFIVIRKIGATSLALIFYIKEKDMEIVNNKVDSMLKEFEVPFKEAAEKNKKLNEELDEKVRALMDEHDKNEDVVRFVKLKDFADYIALTVSMPLKEETKEEIIEELMKECEINGTEV